MAQLFPGISLLFAFSLPLQKNLSVERQRLCIAAFQLCGVITLLLVLMMTEGHVSLEKNDQHINYMY